jgi:class 3 adenylate cyclase
MDNVGEKELFFREHELLDCSRKLLENCPEDTIPKAEYEHLLQSYAGLLRELSKLTRRSDKSLARLNELKLKLKRYVSPPIFKKITSGQEMVEINKTRRVKLSIFYSDIVGFTHHSREMEGETLSTFLNSYLEEMTNIINQYGGTLDKFIGDAIMVFFGDPDFTSDEDHALRCVKMALRMRSRLKELRKYWFDLGYANPLRVRMGIATGYVSVGNFGSSERLDYTIIGSPVNLASRIQEQAPEDQILISHSTWALVKNIIPCAEAISLNLKGFDSPEPAHLVLAENEADRLMVLEDSRKGFCLQYNPTKISKEDLLQELGRQIP